MKAEEMGTAENTTTTATKRQEEALERFLSASDFLLQHNYLTDKEVVELYSVGHQARKGMAKKNGLTRREAQLLRGIFILLRVIKRLLLRLPKAKK